MTLRALVALTLAAAAVAAQAQPQDDYPSRPIRLITPAAPGGTTDILARLTAAKLTESMRQQVLVDNRASASGINAGEITARAAPDGYTLFLVYHQHTINAALNSKLPYHPVDDFTPISQLTTAGLMLVVNPSSPPRTAKEFVEWTRGFKGGLNFGSAGIGSGGHLAGELFNLMAGVKGQHIPYKGSGPALADLLGGQYHYNFAGMQAAQNLVRAGKLRGLAVTNPKRVPAMPDIPAMAEVIPGFEVVGWYGIAGPARMPKALVSRLNTELLNMLRLPDVRERIINDGSEPIGNSPEAFRAMMREDLAKWAKLVKLSGAKFN
jgi:tripartite-type tricarboxylate transporter receptor subunit TctC